ncbi:hypothetical protein [Piscibacillus salipiscarius]|uniref:hypothetical protein n=1 Tax=Piscibacillus salipiscarius TaxID=299480 RepID=UPI0006D1917C|nr:hypothetical protein [Piscibacillus salipiscarius]
MGQYFIAVNLDRQEFLYPIRGSGAKLMQHSYIGNEFVETIARLFSKGNPWYKSRLVWAGDYMDERIYLDEFESESFMDEKGDYNLYHYSTDHFNCLTPFFEFNSFKFTQSYSYIVNHCKKTICRHK